MCGQLSCLYVCKAYDLSRKSVSFQASKQKKTMKEN